MENMLSFNLDSNLHAPSSNVAYTMRANALALRDIALFGTTSHIPKTLDEMQARVIFSFQTILPPHTKS